MGKMIRINVARYCPWLKKNEGEEITVVIDPEREISGSDAICFKEGATENDEEYIVVDGTVVSDSYIANKTVAVELKCKGCSNLPEGFTKVVRERLH